MGTDIESSDTVTGLLALLGPLAIWGTAFGVKTATSTSEIASGQCSGIGFGCTLSPRDLAGMTAPGPPPRLAVTGRGDDGGHD